MSSTSLFVKGNLKSPPLALLQPRASLRAKEKETVEIAYSGQQINALEEISVEGNTIQIICENPMGKVGPSSSPRRNSSERGTPMRNQPTCFAL